MREIESEPQRRHFTPSGQRNCSNAARHSASVSKSTIKRGKVILRVTIGVSSVPKKASEMTDKELVRKLFPAPVRKALKEVLAELNAEKPKREKQPGKRKKR